MSQGGGVYVEESTTLSVTRSSFTSCTAGTGSGRNKGEGGAIYTGSSSSLTLEDCDFTHCLYYDYVSCDFTRCLSYYYVNSTLPTLEHSSTQLSHTHTLNPSNENATGRRHCGIFRCILDQEQLHVRFIRR